MILLLALLLLVSGGGAYYAFAGGNDTARKRVAAVARPDGKGRGRVVTAEQNSAAKRKNVAVMLKDMEKNKQREKPTLRRRLEQAGFFKTAPRTYWIVSGCLAAVTVLACLLTGQKALVTVLAAFAESEGARVPGARRMAARRKNLTEGVDVEASIYDKAMALAGRE